MIPVGFGAHANPTRVLLVTQPDSAPLRRQIQRAGEAARVWDVTNGRRTRSLLLLDDGTVILSAVQVSTLLRRLRAARAGGGGAP